MEKTKGNPQINPTRIKTSEYERTVYVATVEIGVPRETIKEPSFWAHFAARLRPWDRIEVRTDDGIYYAELLVLSCGRNWAKVHELLYVPLTSGDISQTQAAESDGIEVRWRGPHLKHSVVRSSDGAVLQEGMATKKEAEVWLEGYRKTVLA